MSITTAHKSTQTNPGDIWVNTLTNNVFVLIKEVDTTQATLHDQLNNISGTSLPSAIAYRWLIYCGESEVEKLITLSNSHNPKVIYKPFDPKPLSARNHGRLESYISEQKIIEINDTYGEY
jgi:hypothetical protein